jgi:hypothetical protein
MPVRKVPSSSLRHSTIVPHDYETRCPLSKPAILALVKCGLGSSRVNLSAPDPSVSGSDKELSLEEVVKIHDDLRYSNTIRVKDVAERMPEH